MDRRSSHAFFAAALVSVAGLPVSAFSQEAAPADGASAAEGETGARASAPNPRLRFTFNGAPFSQVLDFFARETGLPVIREAEVPGGSLTFISAADYTLNEALEILNLNLAMHGRILVRQENFLYFRTLADAARKPGKVFNAEDLDDVDPSQYLTITIPLSNSNADQVVEQVKPLIKAPGLAQAVQPQNMVMIVETAAQYARIRERELEQLAKLSEFIEGAYADDDSALKPVQDARADLQRLEGRVNALVKENQGLSAEVQGVSTRLEEVAELNRAMAVKIDKQSQTNQK